MKKSRFAFLAFALAIIVVFGFNNCGVGNYSFQTRVSNDDILSNSLSTRAPGANVVSIDAGGCGGYINEPCVSVTVCTPGTNSCQTIDRLLLDTGSYGLRVFSSVIKISLPTLTDNSSRSYAECIEYLDGSIQWGPIKKADILMGNLKASNVSVQIVDKTFASVPSSCSDSPDPLDSGPEEAGFNGILGVGLFANDCGDTCVKSSTNGIYYTCSGTSCSGSSMPLLSQVTNPVALLPSDNNGVIVELPAITSEGAIQVTGSLILGIDTRANNSASSMKLLQADGYGDILTTFNGRTTFAFIDSGSNGLYFPGSSVLNSCTASGLTSFLCPSSPVNYSATLAGASGTPTSNVSFQIANAQIIHSSSNPNWVFNNLGGQYTDSFDWGLPFFFGRRIAFGIEGKSSSIGTGPYYAY